MHNSTANVTDANALVAISLVSLLLVLGVIVPLILLSVGAR